MSELIRKRGEGGKEKKIKINNNGKENKSGRKSCECEEGVSELERKKK